MTADARPASPPPAGAAAQPGDDYEALYRHALVIERERDTQQAMLAHELRNPLNALQISVEVLKRAAPGSREAASAHDVIGRQVRKLAELIELRLPVNHRPWPPSPPPGAPPRSLRIGVIEDNPDALFGLCGLLEMDGHQMLTARDGPDGLAMLLREAPDVAFVDIGMPGFDGHEVAQRSRAAGYQGRLIALSGHGEPEDLARSLAAGFETHLTKPVDHEILTLLLQP